MVVSIQPLQIHCSRHNVYFIQFRWNPEQICAGLLSERILILIFFQNFLITTVKNAYSSYTIPEGCIHADLEAQHRSSPKMT